MRINHNISAMVSQNLDNSKKVSLTNALEKLSTGLRINRSSSDTVSLTVAEVLQGQIRGLERAKRNAEDASQQMQISEGESREISSMLQKISELANQSSAQIFNSDEEPDYSTMGVVTASLIYAKSDRAVEDVESPIKDMDIATEATHATKEQILSQFDRSMLAQGNTVPKGVLHLLA